MLEDIMPTFMAAGVVGFDLGLFSGNRTWWRGS